MDGGSRAFARGDAEDDCVSHMARRGLERRTEQSPRQPTRLRRRGKRVRTSSGRYTYGYAQLLRDNMAPCAPVGMP